MNTYAKPGADWPDKLKSMSPLEFSDRARKVLACMNAEGAVDFSDAEIERTLSGTVAPAYCIAVAKEARDRGFVLPQELTDEKRNLYRTARITGTRTYHCLRQSLDALTKSTNYSMLPTLRPTRVRQRGFGRGGSGKDGRRRDTNESATTTSGRKCQATAHQSFRRGGKRGAQVSMDLCNPRKHNTSA